MLVKCIDNQGWEDFLTKGKVYEIVTKVEENSAFIIKDDKGRYGSCGQWRFKEVNENFISNLERENEELKAKIEELEKSINKQEDKKEEPFIEEGQKYFTINRYLEVEKFNYADDGLDKKLLNNGNIFPFTEETEDKVRKEVELIAKRGKLQSEMEMFARLNNDCEIDWNNSEQMKFYLYIDYEENEIREGLTFGIRHFNTTYFTSEEVLKKALEKFGDRIRELYIDNTTKEGDN